MNLQQLQLGMQQLFSKTIVSNFTYTVHVLGTTECSEGGGWYMACHAYNRVCNLKYVNTATNDFMHLVKHCAQVLIISACCVDLSCNFA